MGTRYIEILKYSLLLKLPQLIGIWFLTGAIVMRRLGIDWCTPDPQGWGLPVNAPFLLIFGLITFTYPTLISLGVVPNKEIQNVSKSERLFWVITELTLMLVGVGFIMFFNIDALKLFWSKSDSCDAF